MIFDKFLSLLPSELDGALIMSEENRRYFSSFPSSDGGLLISRNGTVFLTDSRYVEAAQKKITVCPDRLTKEEKSYVITCAIGSTIGVLHKWTRDNFDLAPEVIAEILTQIFLSGMLPLLS